jgi:hypothetical protein
MHPDQFRSALRKRPFRQFTIHTASGETYTVAHPEVAWQSPAGQTVIVSIRGEEVAMLDTTLISEIVFSTNQPATETKE